MINFIKYLSGFYWIKSTKLYLNDSLSFLYILSSSVYTLLFLGFLVFILLYARKIISFSPALFWFNFILYFLCILSARNYAITFLQISNANITLQNGLLNIHPIFIYYMYANIIYIWLRLYLSKSHNYFDINSLSRVYWLILLSCFGMYLGAFWANQELNWGGFWSWDPVEIISLVGILFITKILHNQTTWFTNKKLLLYAFVVWLVFLVIRLGAISTIHSFIRSNNKMLFVNISIFYMLTWCSFYILPLIKFGRIFIMQQYIKSMYKILVTILFVYAQLYIVYLLIANNLLIDILHISIFFIFFFLFTIIYFIFVYKSSRVLYVNILNINILCSIYILYNINGSIFVVLIMYIFASNFIRIYSTTHLCFLFIYIIYFIFMLNLPFYSCALYIDNTSYSFNNSSTSLGAQLFYETNFFLKKQLFLNRLKNMLIHVNGFTIYNNGTLSIYIFTKNFGMNYLFSIEFIQTAAVVITIIILFFVKLMFVNNKHKSKQLFY